MSTISLEFIVNSPASTSVGFTPASPWAASGSGFAATGPIASGSTVGTLAVTPSSWSGVLALSGPSAASFSLSGLNLITAAALSSGTYNVTVTATP